MAKKGNKTRRESKKAGLHDSGNRTVYSTGSLKDVVEGKGRFDLLSPISLHRLAVVLEKGAIKYGDPRDWEKGRPLSVFLDSALRHLFQVSLGNVDEDHIAQAFWNIHGFIHTQAMIKLGKLPKELDDIPRRTKKTMLELLDVMGVGKKKDKKRKEKKRKK